MSETIFDKIIKKEIPATIIYEDDKCLAFKDINPVAEFHVLLIPKVKGNLDKLSNAQESDAAILGHLMVTAAKIVKENGFAEKGFRLVVNDGENGLQSVFHLHLHILAGQKMCWPPGTGGIEKSSK